MRAEMRPCDQVPHFHLRIVMLMDQWHSPANAGQCAVAWIQKVLDKMVDQYCERSHDTESLCPNGIESR